MNLIDKKKVREMMKEGKLKDVNDIQDLLKEQFGELIEEMLEGELDHELGYSKYDYREKETTNSRNGKREKQLKSNYGNLEIEVPRDREGEFEPQVVKKNQRDVSSIDDQVLSMYAKGMTVRDIQTHLQELYGVDASPTLISGITDKIVPLIKEWQNRPLSRIYAHVVMDAVHYKVRQDGRIVNKAAYMAIGIDLDGMKDVLGIWIGENESSKYWLKIINELKNRGVEDILIVSIDGLKGFEDAIHAVYPQTEIQSCIIHQIRNSTRYISYKDRKEFCSDLKNVYRAPTEEVALIELDKLEEKWGDKYEISIRSWRNNWDKLSVMFKYPEEVRKLIYTNNSMESYNRQLRKVTKSKSIFPTDESLLKMLYLATMDITKKWTMRTKNWAQILGQLSIYFEGRI
ncbi:IS256 family transposase [Natranaerobius thermophilus]|uniref:Mutator family transposase n=2 Tax=Natranaerobius TaxID=375928 RepID=B2A140_NATTJ|nr:IS256 family transposase [Natranaerobius thermophilus]ACB84473.1 transposase mutator type [Natranaerobius thermophilus JW/NM-WN-LF]ACB84663.1 transposase mutator type [Natranaerobius thermophilus JW/NM-WN-LF]